LKKMKVKDGKRKWGIENSGDWLLRRPRLTQGCSAEEEEEEEEEYSTKPLRLL
jgi:hypothetical protein